MQVNCDRCGSYHINRKPVQSPFAMPLIAVVFAALTFGAYQVIHAATGLSATATFMLMFVGAIVIVPVIWYATYIIVKSVAAPSLHSTCHDCGNVWHEKGASLHKQTAPTKTGAQTPSRH